MHVTYFTVTQCYDSENHKRKKDRVRLCVACFIPVSWVCRGLLQVHDVFLTPPLSWLLALCQSPEGLDTPRCHSLS